ncbi:hypothetical protein OBP_049 [Pseudomonas phage OBP]|uniref:hypothetical protein n=1 Tax=Pseudomonas phage OBP TaxID=1124849 RepID=UPI000240D62E|nr:hypothetical protein OBP_049 [Pseudomonas phage OBP]AEV89486.1 hypothetical protein OBP_049 [Pseudomonas phage OBP]
MYSIDKRGLTSAIAIALIPQFKNENPEEDLLTYNFHLVLDMVLGVMNSDTRNIDDAIDDQYRLYPEERNLAFLAEVIRLEVIDIKKQFMQAGFDRRLKYKLVTRNVGAHKFYGIAMDLDATTIALTEAEPVVETDNAFAVSQEPSIDELEAAFNW